MLTTDSQPLIILAGVNGANRIQAQQATGFLSSEKEIHKMNKKSTDMEKHRDIKYMLENKVEFPHNVSTDF